MNIIYRKNTLYVYLKENIDGPLVARVEDRINNIIGSYDIDNLVIKTRGQDISALKGLESRYNANHTSHLTIR